MLLKERIKGEVKFEIRSLKAINHGEQPMLHLSPYLLFDKDFSISADFVFFPEIDLVKRVWFELLGLAHLPHSSCIHRCFVFLVIKHVVLIAHISYRVELQPHGVRCFLLRRTDFFLLHIEASISLHITYRSLLWLSTVKYFLSLRYEPFSPVSSSFQLTVTACLRGRLGGVGLSSESERLLTWPFALR